MSIKSEHVVMANRPGCLLFCVVIFVFEKTDVFHQVCYFVRPIYIELEENLINNKDTIKPELLQQFGCDDDDYVQITVSPVRLRLSRNKCFILLVENKSFSSTDYCRKKNIVASTALLSSVKLRFVIRNLIIELVARLKNINNDGEGKLTCNHRSAVIRVKYRDYGTLWVATG